MVCFKFDFFGKSIVCKICHDNYHLDCLNSYVTHPERGRFFHENIFEKQIYELYQMEKSISKNIKNKTQKIEKITENKKKNIDVYWVCPKCTKKIFNPERIFFKLEFPFEIQKLPEISQNKIYSEDEYNIIRGDVSEYRIPENLEEAFEDRKMVFKDDCVYLTTAKAKHNSLKYAKEQIDVNI